MKKYILVQYVVVFLISIPAFSQVGVGTTSPKTTLDVQASSIASTDNNTGIGFPVVTNFPVGGNVAGQIIYADVAATPPTYFYKFTGVTWDYLLKADLDGYPGDIKQGFQTADHNGWFLLNGRSVASLGLTATQTAQATALGLTINLPDATNRVVKKKGSTFLVAGGANTQTIAKTNLPSISFSGVTNNNSHTHAYADDHSGAYDGASNPNGSSGGKNVTNANETSTSGGAHDHTGYVDLGGSGTPLNVESPYLGVNTFIYLGK